MSCALFSTAMPSSVPTDLPTVRILFRVIVVEIHQQLPDDLHPGLYLEAECASKLSNDCGLAGRNGSAARGRSGFRFAFICNKG